MRGELIAAMLVLSACSGVAQAQVVRPAAIRIDAAIAEAAQRSGVPGPWIRSVIRRESGGDAAAISPKGAMGLMQLMPDTWADLRARLGLGADPYDVRDNILAGAVYLRQLYDQFGAGGFLAAYNAGPRRYLDFVRRGRELPAETRVYMAAVGRALSGAPATAPAAIANPAAPLALATASVFVDLDSASQHTAAAPRGLFVGGPGR